MMKNILKFCKNCYDLNAIDNETKYVLAHSSVEERTKEECYKFLKQIKDFCYRYLKFTKKRSIKKLKIEI